MVVSCERLRVGEVVIDVVTREAVLAQVDQALRGDGPRLVLTSANLDHLHHFATGDRVLPSGPSGEAGRWLWWCLLDGRPVVRRARRLLSRPVEGAPGSDLLGPVLERAAARAARVGLVGGSAATRAAWETQLSERYSELVVAGTWQASWSRLDDEPGYAATLAEAVAAAGVDVLVVSLGKPRQEEWLRDNVARTGALVALPFGSAVDYVVGTATRPPSWTRRAGIEWLYRLVREPRRLARRYAVEGPPALRLLWRETRVEGTEGIGGAPDPT